MCNYLIQYKINALNSYRMHQELFEYILYIFTIR